MVSSIPPSIVRLDRALHELRLELDLEPYFNPCNVQEEWRRFRQQVEQGIPYNPQFRYQEPPPALRRTIERLGRLSAGTCPFWSSLYREAILSTERSAQMVAGRREEELTEFSGANHGFPPGWFCQRAWEILQTTPLSGGSPSRQRERQPPGESKEGQGERAPRRRTPRRGWQGPEGGKEGREVKEEGRAQRYQDRQMAELFEKMFQDFGWEGWQIAIEPAMSARVSVRMPNRMLRIRAGARFDQQEVERLRVHEIETHVRRGENGALQPLRLFESGFPRYSATEEGLAIWSEEQVGVRHPQQERTLAAMVCAVDRARRASFFETYEQLAPWLTSPWQAFSVVLRVKRGMRDTSLPGAYVKDYIYLWGRVQLERFLKEGRQLSTLYLGKISVDQVPWVEELLQRGELHPPLLPAFLQPSSLPRDP